MNTEHGQSEVLLILISILFVVCIIGVGIRFSGDYQCPEWLLTIVRGY
jgi:hypothetical protein